MYEVEQKFPVAGFAAVEAALTALGAKSFEPINQVDTYFAHPTRDFAQTDEAFRLRQVGDANCVTYKGPKLDRTTKTRREIELPLGSGDEVAAQFQEMLVLLGFRPVLAVAKTRRPWELVWQGRQVHAALDEVAGLGTFVELEITSEAADLDAAQAALHALAAQLGLEQSERRSYLELLLTRPS